MGRRKIPGRQSKPEANKIKAVITHPATLAFAKIFIGVIFILASVTKVGDPVKFSDSIASYRMVPEIFLPSLSVIIPWLQLICGVLLILDVYVQSSAFILSGLLVVYIIAIAQAYMRGIDIDCGCFDLMIGLEDKVGIRAILRDFVFLAFSSISFFFDKNDINIWGLKKKFFK